MKKYLVTVQWSTTVQVEIPDGMEPESLIECDWQAPDDVQKLAVEATKNAWSNVGMKDGVITYVQEEQE